MREFGTESPSQRVVNIKSVNCLQRPYFHQCLKRDFSQVTTTTYGNGVGMCRREVISCNGGGGPGSDDRNFSGIDHRERWSICGIANSNDALDHGNAMSARIAGEVRI